MLGELKRELMQINSKKRPEILKMIEADRTISIRVEEERKKIDLRGQIKSEALIQ